MLSTKFRRAFILAGSLAAAGLLATPADSASGRPTPVLKIVQDSLLEAGNFYFVKGSIYNPNAKPVKNVVIRYYVWGKWRGQDGYGWVIKNTGGLVTATIKYVPPKHTVAFTATGADNAPVMTPESGLVPDPLDAKITAEWDH